MDAPIIVNKAKHAKNVCKRQSGCCVPLKVEPRQLKGPCPNVLLGSSGTIATHILLFPRPNHVNLPRGRRTCIGPCRMSSLSARCTCTASCSSRIYFLKRYTFETKKVNLVSFQKMRSIFCFKKLFLKRYKVRIFLKRYKVCIFCFKKLFFWKDTTLFFEKIQPFLRKGIYTYTYFHCYGLQFLFFCFLSFFCISSKSKEKEEIPKKWYKFLPYDFKKQ